ncbi:MAG: hypothetical protein KGV51_07795 [Moraxellaceae bacterium]|nr:hypothetical protein [Moraxellaceae bacterium]
MKLSTLTKAVTSVLVATLATSAMAAGSLTETTGNKLVKMTDTAYTKLTGKAVNDVVVNHPVSLFDYKQADSSYEDAYLNGTLNVNDNEGKKTAYDLKLGVDYEKSDSTPNRTIKYDAGINGQVSKGGDEDSERTENYQGHASVTYDKYFNPQTSDAFWYGKGAVKVQQSPKDNDDYAGLENPEVKLTGGIGYGRVVNVTPMAKTIRLVEALVENGNLARVPSAGTYQKIAQIIEKEDEYRKKFSDARYAQYWIRDIQKALGVNLGASGTIRAYDVLTKEKISTRKYGWDVRAGVGGTVSDYNGDSGKPLLELQGNYYYPISNKTQFSNEAKLTTILDDDDDGSYSFTNDMGVTYELTDRVDWENKWNFSYVDNEDKNTPDVTSNMLSSAFLYELTNSLDYEAKATLSHVKVEDADSSTDKGLYMGIKYRLK